MDAAKHMLGLSVCYIIMESTYYSDAPWETYFPNTTKRDYKYGHLMSITIKAVILRWNVVSQFLLAI